MSQSPSCYGVDGVIYRVIVLQFWVDFMVRKVMHEKAVKRILIGNFENDLL